MSSKLLPIKAAPKIHIPWNKKGELGLENPAIARQRQLSGLKKSFTMKLLFQYILHNITARWLKRDMIVCGAKIWSLRGRTSILLKIGENCERLGNIWQVFSNVGRTYFTLSVDRFLTSTTNNKNSNATRALDKWFFFVSVFFFPMFRFVVVFFSQICNKDRKKYHLVRIVPHRNCTDTCFSKMFYQYYSRSRNIALSNTSGILIRHWSKRITWKNIPQL